MNEGVCSFLCEKKVIKNRNAGFDLRSAPINAISVMRYARIGAGFLFAFFFAVGCAGGPEVTVSYDAERNRTIYETRSFTISRGSGNSYGSSKTIDMEAVAYCRGPDCSPGTVELVFSASGGEALSLSGTGGEIEADGVVVTWTSAEASKGVSESRSNTEMYRAVGEFAVVPISLDQLREITSASSVKGTIGGMRLQFRSGVRSGLQALLRKIDQQGAGSETLSSEQ